MGSGPGYRRTMLVLQSDEFNKSAIGTSVCATITSNMRRASPPGNVRISGQVSRQPHDSVVNMSKLVTLDKRLLTGKVSRLSVESLREVEAGIKLVLALR